MTSLAPARPHPTPAEWPRHLRLVTGAPALRIEIQALRALAVGLVVVYHLWPRVLPGGFVGVDVFFAISGYLITSLLLRELERDGRISLRRFWARRARRILPAALLVLAFCAVATILVVPITAWQQYFADLRASTAYVQNWHLAATAVDYLHASDAPSPAQHFWSLSVEEQFYLAWPLIVIAAAWLGGRRRRAVLAVAMGAFTAASLAYGIAHTTSDPAAAYFVTPTRAWELGAGGLLALLVQRERSPLWARAGLAWAGLAAIAVAAATYSTATPFPGVAALLPVLGALAVIRAGAPAAAWAPTRGYALRAVQAIGDRSYGIYLWHWPLLILAPYVLHHGVDTPTASGILMLTLLTSWLTKLLVEDPVRHGAFLVARGTRWTFAAAGAATLAVLGVEAGGAAHVQAQIRADARAGAVVLAHRPPCFGAAAHDLHGKRCDNAKLRFKVTPSPVAAGQMPNAPCADLAPLGRARPCTFGVADASKATKNVLLLGDSHASHWRAALAEAAKARRWHGVSVTHTSCPFSRAAPLIPQPARGQCVQWQRDARRWIARHPEIDTIFVAQHSGGRVVAGGDNFAAQIRGYTAAWHGLPKTVKHIIVIRDTPKMHGDTLSCVERALAQHHRPGTACAVPRGVALGPDSAAVAAARMHSGRVKVIDLNQYLCARTCPPVIGGALVYKDIHHLTTVFAATLAPYLLKAYDKAVTAPGAA
jgi:peptidoglycan/LPS O-acetylase OafA/YrhL